MPMCSHFYEKYTDRNKITRNFAKVLQTSHYMVATRILNSPKRFGKLLFVVHIKK